jgi:dynein heavy chain
LVAVFAAGDIAKQMPTESKKFKQIDRLWLKIMERANDNRNVIKQCSGDFLKSQLPSLKDGLDLCQRKLEDYLETKRSVFPRFYFCSDDVLLKILSVGSDPHAVQDDFENFFEAINRVSFDEQDRKLIVDIRSVMGSSEEAIQLVDPVKAEGNIEEWLCRLELEMKRSMRGICARGARDCFSLPLREFIDSCPA